MGFTLVEDGVYMLSCYVSLLMFSMSLLVKFSKMATETDGILMELELIDVKQQVVFLRFLKFVLNLKMMANKEKLEMHRKKC